MTVENEILDLENRFWTSMKDKDVETALQLVDDPCIVTGPKEFRELTSKLSPN